MNDTPTPRTDAAELTEPYEIRALGFCVVHIDFARQLERERDEAQEQRDTLAAAMIAMLPFIEDGDYPNCSLTAFHAAIMKYKASLWPYLTRRR